MADEKTDTPTLEAVFAEVKALRGEVASLRADVENDRLKRGEHLAADQALKTRLDNLETAVGKLTSKPGK